jgi:predicted esterase
MSESTRLEKVETTVEGRYWVREAATTVASPVLVGFHGYGEDAEALLREINLIPGVTDWTLIAIQALHPFYRGRTGEVVASWMTHLDRESAIRHNVAYVAKVLDQESVPAGRGDGPPLVFAGFSQGTAMAYRAAVGAGRACRGVVALGGDVPPELADGALSGLPVALIGRGSRDEWYTEEKLAQDVEILQSQGVSCRPVRFEGGHEWTDGFRAMVARFLAGLRPDFES